ncbi:MAG TPA: hypothetical protein VJJ76_02455 [archaeon]|nr:hypothetical protein [archaeon]
MSYYRPKSIAEIDFRNDVKVAVIGRVAAVGEKTLMLDDGKNKAEITFDKLQADIKPEKFYRIFCSIVEKQLRADIVQNLNAFDVNLFSRTEELYKKSGV